MDEPKMAAFLISHHRPGFYFRVLEEGEVGAGDEITKASDGPERMTVAEMSGLLYLPGHPGDQLQGSLRIQALSPDWKSSLQALLNQASADRTGNAGLTAAAGPPPAWTGFRSLRVTRLDRECAGVISLSFEATDQSRLPAALPGQYLVLKLRPERDAPTILRNYSISSAPDAGIYRVSIKQEVNGTASTFRHNQINAGDVLEVSAPRGGFTLLPGEGPVALLSAGIGATPVLAMLHALVSTRSPREVWWLYGARDGNDHPFVEESRRLLHALTRGRSHIVDSRPVSEDRPGYDYDAPGRLSV
jgi:ferredoxin-NADP reductase